MFNILTNNFNVVSMFFIKFLLVTCLSVLLNKNNYSAITQMTRWSWMKIIQELLYKQRIEEWTV